MHVLDLLPSFGEHEGPELWVHPSNQHPNEIGHQIAGEALWRFLVDEGLAAGVASDSAAGWRERREAPQSAKGS
jgi:hypothetical protein